MAVLDHVSGSRRVRPFSLLATALVAVAVTAALFVARMPRAVPFRFDEVPFTVRVAQLGAPDKGAEEHRLGLSAVVLGLPPRGPAVLGTVAWTLPPGVDANGLTIDIFLIDKSRSEASKLVTAVGSTGNVATGWNGPTEAAARRWPWLRAIASTPSQGDLTPNYMSMSASAASNSVAFEGFFVDPAPTTSGSPQFISRTLNTDSDLLVAAVLSKDGTPVAARRLWG